MAPHPSKLGLTYLILALNEGSIWPPEWQAESTYLILAVSVALQIWPLIQAR